MGESETIQGAQNEQRGLFMKAVLSDLYVLDQMLRSGMIESGIQRIGAEQEMFLVDRDAQPAPVAAEILQRLNEPRLTTEIGRFNLEANVTPVAFTRHCLRALEMELNYLISQASRAAEEVRTSILLTGILPTLNQGHLTLDNLTDNPRYHELNRALTYFRGKQFYIHIKGVDEIHVTHVRVAVGHCQFNGLCRGVYVVGRVQAHLF